MMLAREIKSDPEHVTIRDAAVVLDRKPWEVLQLVEAGEIADEVRDGRRFVVHASLKAYMADTEEQQ